MPEPSACGPAVLTPAIPPVLAVLRQHLDSPSGPPLMSVAHTPLGEEESCAGAEQGSVSTDTSEKSFPAIRFACPKCGTAVTVSQSQGDRCPGCDFEFKWFLPHEGEPARDYYAVLTGEKYLVELPDSAGWVVAHY